MDDRALSEEAEDCRRKALSYLGRPEAPFLIRLAGEFERIGQERQMRSGEADGASPGLKSAMGGKRTLGQLLAAAASCAVICNSSSAR